jgi:hypothetical protein
VDTATRETGEALPSPTMVESWLEAGGRISREAKSATARRESEEVVAPLMAVQDNAVGGNGLYFVCARVSR